MGKLFLFSILWWLTGNPFVAVIVLLIVLYVLDRRFVGLFPSIIRPIRRSRALSRIRRELELQPHNTSAKHEAARLLIEKKRFAEALRYLEQIRPVIDSADVEYETGFCLMKLGRLEEGERLVLRSLEMNPRVKYGEPYLRLGELFAGTDPEKAIRYLEQFRQLHSASCEGYYRLGVLYGKLGRAAEAKQAFQEAIHIYRGLPKYKRRSERRWALLAWLRSMG